MGTLESGRLIEDGRLTGDRLIEVGLYHHLFGKQSHWRPFEGTRAEYHSLYACDLFQSGA